MFSLFKTGDKLVSAQKNFVGVSVVELLPYDILVYLLSFLEVKDYPIFFSLCSAIARIANDENFWKTKFRQCVDFGKLTAAFGNEESTNSYFYTKHHFNWPHHLSEGDSSFSWKDCVRKLPHWKWSYSISRKAPEIIVSNDAITAKRIERSGRNPAVMTKTPLTKIHPFFRVEIKRVGSWIGIGVADNLFVMSSGSTLGTQPKGPNSSYFWQNTGIKKLQMFKEAAFSDVADIKEGNFIDIFVDFDNNMIYFYNNEILQGVITCTKCQLIEGELFPCVNLSYDSAIVFRNFDLPMLNLRPKFRWDNLRRAPSISISTDGLRASRTSGKGMNPAVMASFPLTSINDRFRVKTKKLGRWIGIGLCDGQFVVNDSKTLGTQIAGFNASYFWQNTGINKVQMYGEKSKDDVSPILAGDIVDIKVDFERNRIYFFKNNNVEWFMCPSRALQQGTLYPCIAMAVGGKVVLKNDERPNLSVYRKLNETLATLLLNWKWSNELSKKAPVIEVSSDQLIARRRSGGNNPSIMTTMPLNSQNNLFCVKIVSLGSWIGIGVADSRFKLIGSAVLGAQDEGLNSSYFYQGNIRKIQLFGTKEITEGILPMATGDIIVVQVNFQENKILYYNNDLFQAAISPKVDLKLEENKIFPCVNLSNGSEIMIINQPL